MLSSQILFLLFSSFYEHIGIIRFCPTYMMLSKNKLSSCSYFKCNNKLSSNLPQILACAPSNIAVDNLVERLGDCGVKIVRLGHPARLLPKIQKYALDAVLSHSEEKQLVKDVRSDMEKTLVSMRVSLIDI